MTHERSPGLSRRRLLAHLSSILAGGLVAPAVARAGTFGLSASGTARVCDLTSAGNLCFGGITAGTVTSTAPATWGVVATHHYIPRPVLTGIIPAGRPAGGSCTVVGVELTTVTPTSLTIGSSRPLGDLDLAAGTVAVPAGHGSGFAFTGDTAFGSHSFALPFHQDYHVFPACLRAYDAQSLFTTGVDSGQKQPFLATPHDAKVPVVDAVCPAGAAAGQTVRIAGSNLDFASINSASAGGASVTLTAATSATGNASFTMPAPGNGIAFDVETGPGGLCGRQQRSFPYPQTQYVDAAAPTRQMPAAIRFKDDGMPPGALGGAKWDLIVTPHDVTGALWSGYASAVIPA